MTIDRPFLRPGPACVVACSTWLAAILACSDASPPPPPRHLIVISVDTLRADQLAAYGSTRLLTPNLDALAGESTVFEHAYAPTPFTLGSIASLMTGLYPEELGIEWNRSILAPGIPTLAQRLDEAGFETRAVVSNFVLRRAKSGIDAGFDHFDDTFTQLEVTRGVPERIGADTTDAALRALDALAPHPGRFFLWVHYQDPHGPYTPGDAARARHRDDERARGDRGRELRISFGGRETGALPQYQYIEPHRDPEFYRAGYEGEVQAMDAAVGRLLDGLRERGLLEESLLVFAADHGESLGEHDYWFAHGEFLHDALVRVPLLLRQHGRPAGRRDDVASLVDVVPTVLETLGLTPPGETSGRDLLARGARDAAQPVYLATLREATRARFGIVADGYKYVVTPRLPGGPSIPGPASERLHRVGAEETALEARAPDEARSMRDRIRRMQADFEIPSTTGHAQELTPEEQRQLESLGYVEDD